MTAVELDALITIRSENEHLEFKEAKNHYSFEELVDYCVALANEGGGKVILGVTDRMPRKVVGTTAFDIPEQTVAGIFERIQLKVVCEIVEHVSGRVLVFTIPSRPIGQPVHYRGRYFMRAGHDLVPMTPDRLKSIFSEGQPDWEFRIARDNCPDEDVLQILDTNAFFELLQIPYPSSKDAVLERLHKQHLIERGGEAWSITNVGAILLANRLSDFDALAGKAARVVVYDGQSKTRTRTDDQGNRGYAASFSSLIRFIMQRVPSNEVIEQALRKRVSMFPQPAVREIVANALVHQDFGVTGGSVMIELYDDRLEVSNPGVPCISTDRFIDEYSSRNERLAELMRQLRVCERKGSGIDLVVEQAEMFQLPAPEIRVTDLRTTIVLFAHRQFEYMNSADRVRACYQHCCLQYVTNRPMNNASLRGRFQVSEDKTATISQIISSAIEAGRIKLGDESTTSTRYRSYVPYWA